MQKVKGMDEPVPEDILREINKCVWTIGYTGQSPERLKAHMPAVADEHLDLVDAGRLGHDTSGLIAHLVSVTNCIR
jgi:hypothetical protein